ncbi:ATPase, partial [Streptomyces sp. A73]|nr:ATPase [Streptomyces sp. A73]
PVLAHRQLPTAQAQLNRRTAEQMVSEILQRVPVPAVGPGPSAPGGPMPTAAPGGSGVPGPYGQPQPPGPRPPLDRPQSGQARGY